MLGNFKKNTKSRFSKINFSLKIIPFKINQDGNPSNRPEFQQVFHLLKDLKNQLGFTNSMENRILSGFGNNVNIFLFRF